MKPILFNTDMVRAIREGRKTVTRRDPFQTSPDYDVLKGLYRDSKNRLCAVFQCRKDPTTEATYARYDRGDILWVRETWGMASDLLGGVPGPVYCADYTDGDLRTLREKHYRWRPSIHMPREAARIFLKVTSVRVERLQDINLDPPGPDNQVIKEGLHYLCDFIAVWEMTIKPTDRPLYGWDANPWVWVIEFEQCEKPEGWPG